MIRFCIRHIRRLTCTQWLVGITFVMCALAFILLFIEPAPLY